MQSNYTLERITDLEELAVALTEHYKPEQTLEQSREILSSKFIFGYKCCVKDAVGFCYILKSDGFYIVDACNEGLKMFRALSTVKTVIKEAFDTYTDRVICGYKVGDVESKIIRRRLGFKKFTTIGDLDLFSLEKE